MIFMALNVRRWLTMPLLLWNLFVETLGLSLFAFAFDMVCFGILVNTKDFTLHVPEPRLHEFDYLPSENCNLCSVNFPL